MQLWNESRHFCMVWAAAQQDAVGPRALHMGPKGLEPAEMEGTEVLLRSSAPASDTAAPLTHHGDAGAGE